MSRLHLWSGVSVGSTAIAAVVILLAATAGASLAASPDALSACRPDVIVGVLPAWARGGFSDPKPQMPYELGRAKRIAAVLWANPLQSPPPQDHTNKILWVSKATSTPGSDLRISAQRMTRSTPVGTPVTRTVMGSPGPSIIDLPSAGCWRLTLRWSGRIDTLDLRYVARS